MKNPENLPRRNNMKQETASNPYSYNLLYNQSYTVGSPVTRSDIIRLYMKVFNIHKIHGGVHANVDLAIRELKNEKYIKVIGRGIYSKI